MRGSESSFRISSTTNSSEKNKPSDPIQYIDVYGLCFNNISNAIVSGICSDMVSVPINEEVRKQPHSHRATASKVQMKPFRKSKAN